ncbi:hypothetical protein [Hydrogenophaga sp. NFH-34]|uniref:hypothetical protein n=1 Tax=Hydrogenophaga sp. NFH-34 TaxID=2744446 RepID=UPI001F41649A|nr:hypothetical protein [Hydrogenophaga sp. NFH-34]
MNMRWLSGNAFSRLWAYAMWALCSVTFVGCSTLAANERGGAEWRPFVPDAATLVSVFRGDVNADGRDDVLLVYAPSASLADAPRVLSVLLREPSGRLRVAATNPRAVLCGRCGGAMGDPFRTIRTDPGAFTLRFEGGSREIWSIEFRFAHVQTGGWRLVGVDEAATDRIHGTRARKQLDPSDFGEVTFDTFDVEAFDVDALP